MFIEVAVYFLYPIFIYMMTSWINLTNSLATDAWLLCMLLIGYTLASAAGSIIVGSFYAMGDMRTPMKIGFIGFVISLLTKSILFLLYGLKGMAVATSLYYVFNTLVMFILLERKVNAKLS
jgi:putative peptidoglycan lipid II flippase